MRATLLVACALLGGCAPEPEVGWFSRRIVGGTLTTAWPEVMLLVARPPGSNLASICTTSMISPHVALTAAHCLDPRLVGSTAQFTIYPGPDVDQAAFGDFLQVGATHFDDQFDPKNVTGGHDIGVVILKDARPSALPINRQGLSRDLVNQAATLVGYGKSDGADSTGTTAGKKRVATTVMGGYTDELVRFGAPGTTSCEGDSGGPGLMDLDGRQTIVGVVSFGAAACDQVASDTRVDAYTDWIDAYIDEADPGYLNGVDRHKDGGCAMGGAAPTGSWLAGLLLAGLAITRRRRAARSLQ